jgi:hypothetical protein
VELHPIQSNAITDVGYDPRRRALAVRFESGRVYEYQDVDEALFRALLESQPHPWSDFGQEIKAHPYRQLA